ncbi:hypothetical protein, partial [Prevotella pectinovora]|uniref:hypothetical protein n=1 Tax=Prevotella pectinovora TaxID=1602169 RepID=UPI0030799A4C
NATKSQRLPQPLETQNKSPNLLFFAFLVILFTENQHVCAFFTHICHCKSILFLSAHHFFSSYVIFWHP